ncbi:hypothetical protein BEN30_02185 [Magnetovibrio blakemorei]|uniref:isochorismate synthase n=1 Tax=Magnetovibrio blakemorei TaxID=28181 RepID=A0A1E5QC95_9PROT|nr:hypothetical protein BEN30_02185 [Magnetovibrio blakemorei]
MLSALLARSDAAAALIGSGITSVTMALPDVGFDGLPQGLPQGLTDFIYWASPEDRHFLLGCEQVVSVETTGQRHIGALAAALQSMQTNWRQFDLDDLGQSPALFTGFPFAAASANDATEHTTAGLSAFLRLPLITLQRQRAVCSLTLNWHRDKGDGEAAKAAWLHALQRLLIAVSSPIDAAPCANPLRRVSATPNDATWLARVGQATQDIHQGLLKKVVLSRHIHVVAPRRFEPARLLINLAQRFPSCVQIAMTGDFGVLAAATPERLIRLKHGRLHSDALAGTWRRDPDEGRDALLGFDLQHSDKALHEHQLVVDAILRRLAPVSSDLTYPEEPLLMRLRGLHHLWTPIEGKPAREIGLLDLAERLHPTPAVGGAPSAAALDWLARHGETRDGLYTGVFGWMTPGGDGDLSVVLRCAVLKDNHAHLSAGAGIVGSSDPIEELAETELKLAAMLDALEEA